MACCPAHVDKHPSLSIDEGNPRKSPYPFVINCRSHGCSAKSILDAMGITWAQVLGDRDPLTPEQRKRFARQAKHEEWMTAWQHALYAVLADRPFTFSNVLLADSLVSLYWRKRAKLYPEEAKLRRQRERVHQTIAKHGWDAVWAKFLSTERGQAIDKQYGRDT
jgi:hypothetical protein